MVLLLIVRLGEVRKKHKQPLVTAHFQFMMTENVIRHNRKNSISLAEIGLA